jgi:hypothetical protein
MVWEVTEGIGSLGRECLRLNPCEALLVPSKCDENRRGLAAIQARGWLVHAIA